MTSLWVRAAWTLRKLANRMEAAARIKSGLPGWIIDPGVVTACPHGKALIEGSCFAADSPDFDDPYDPEDLIDLIVMAYPDCVEHDSLPDQCEVCYELLDAEP